MGLSKVITTTKVQTAISVVTVLTTFLTKSHDPPCRASWYLPRQERRRGGKFEDVGARGIKVRFISLRIGVIEHVCFRVHGGS